jgi:hypothetical protein
LVALQKRHGDQLTILGVSLDFVPDSHGHIGGHAAVEEQGTTDAKQQDHDHAQIREKVARTVKARKINYTVLLDEKNEVGGRYNGGELPTTVIIDAGGRVRRRFIGERTQPVFDAMINEAKKPLSTAAPAVTASGAH